MEKPTTIACKEFRQKIIDSINTSRLPAFVIVLILESALNDVKRIEEMQYAADKEAYEKSLIDSDGD